MMNITDETSYGKTTRNILIFLSILALAKIVTAAPKEDFNILVADSQATIYSINPRTGERAIVAQFDKLDRPYDLAQGRDGQIVVSDTGTLRIVAVNPVTGEQTIVAQGSETLGVPYGLDVDRHGNIYVANSAAIVRVSASGDVETVASGGLLKVPLDVAVAQDGSLYVADALAGVVRVDRGGQTLVSRGGFLQTSVGITLDHNHTAYVVDGGGRCVVAVDIRKGTQTVVSAADNLTTPVGIAVCPDGTLLVSDPDAFDLSGGILLLAKDGTQTEVARGEGELVNPRGILVVPSLD